MVDDGLSQKLATVAGAGISINSLWSVHRELGDGSLVRVLPDYHVNEQTALWLVYPQSHVMTDTGRVVIACMLEKVGAAPLWLNSQHKLPRIGGTPN